VEAINQEQRRYFLNLVRDHFQGQLAGRVLAVWGLSFKPWTDDVRQAPALEIVAALLQAGAQIRAYDPQAVKAAQEVLGPDHPNIAYAADMYEAAAGAEALLIHTDWTMFRTPDFSRLRSRLRQPVIFDGRNLYDPRKVAQLGFLYYYIGGRVPPSTGPDGPLPAATN